MVDGSRQMDSTLALKATPHLSSNPTYKVLLTKFIKCELFLCYPTTVNFPLQQVCR